MQKIYRFLYNILRQLNSWSVLRSILTRLAVVIFDSIHPGWVLLIPVWRWTCGRLVACLWRQVFICHLFICSQSLAMQVVVGNNVAAVLW